MLVRARPSAGNRYGEIVRYELPYRPSFISAQLGGLVAEWRNETALVSSIVKDIKKKYPTAFIIKVHGGPMQEPGLPDLICCIEGFFFGLEVKHQKLRETEEHARDRTTPLQRIKIQLINAAGGTACTILTPEEALEVIDRGLTRYKEKDASAQDSTG